MSSIKTEYKSMVMITATGFTLNLLLGLAGFFLPYSSYWQLLFFQAGDAAAIMASVMAARYTGLRAQHVAASAFILLGITHGISLASSGLEGFHVEKGITVIMPMVPSLLLLYWCSLFPLWLRVAVIIPLGLFIYVYVDVITGGTYYNRPLRLAYLSWMLIEILWSVYLIKDWREQLNNSAG